MKTQIKLDSEEMKQNYIWFSVKAMDLLDLM